MLFPIFEAILENEEQNSPTMRFINLLALYIALVGMNVQAEEDKCPKKEYACFDVINSSLCLSQTAARGTKEEMAKCVELVGGASNLTGAAKVSLRSVKSTALKASRTPG